MKKLEFLLPSYQNIKAVSYNNNMREKTLSQALDNASYIVKGNALVEARYRLSLQESHVILWLLTQIKPDDEDFKLHKLDISEFATMVGLKSAGQYTELQSITENLMRRILKIKEPETQDIIQVAWLSFVKYQKRKGCVLLRFDPGLKPYLLQLQSQFTKIDIVDTLKLKSIYAIRVFELLLQYISIGSRKIELSDLRSHCGINQKEYSLYADLKRKVIEKAKTEISNKTEYEVDYSEIKESRKVVAIEWIIKKKDLNKKADKQEILTLKKELRSESALVTSLHEYGYSKMMTKRLIKQHGEEDVKQAVRVVDIQIEKGKAKNPKALLWSALIKDWKPDVYTPHNK